MRAAEWAAEEAQRHKAPLRLVSAAAMPPRMRARDSGLRTVADELCGESARALSEAVSRSAEVSSRLVIDASLLIGPPALAVTDSGAGALMLVVGARGAGGFAAMLLGSVGRYAAMHACCPVIVVREGQASDVRPEVVVGIRDPQDTATLAFAFDEADLRGASLVVVHSWNGLPAATWRPADPARLAAEADKNLAEALDPGGTSTLASPSGRMWSTITRPGARLLQQPRGPRRDRQARQQRRARRRRDPARGAQPCQRLCRNRPVTAHDGRSSTARPGPSRPQRGRADASAAGRSSGQVNSPAARRQGRGSGLPRGAVP